MPPPRLQNVRVRECSVLFFLEDGTIQAEEKRQDNSGMMQVRAQRSTAGSHWRWSAGAGVADGVRVRWKDRSVQQSSLHGAQNAANRAFMI